REEATKDDEFGLGGDYDDEEDDEDWGGNADWTAEEDDEAGDVKDKSAAYLEFLNSEAQKYNAITDNDGEDDELEEESLLETPLDKLEPYGMFKSALMQLQHQQPQLYQNLTSNLNPEEQQVVQSAVMQADAITAQAVAEQAQQGHDPIDVAAHVNGNR
ncbi:hypothetical protein LTR28_012130, partial [Elasticomyces elasticus]